MEDLNLHEICYLCITKQEHLQTMTQEITDKLFECATVQLLPSQSLICDLCKNEINKWHLFKQQVLRSLEVVKCIQKKKDFILKDNYIVMEEIYIKNEFNQEPEEIDVKPDIIHYNDSLNEEDSNELEVSPPNQNTFKCEICNETLQTSTHYLNHVKLIHNNMFKNPKSATKITEDPTENQQKTNYQCDLCHKSFTSEVGITWHKKLHSALKLDSSKGNTTLFSCIHCPMTYEKKSSLIDHMNWKHHQEINLHICDFCGKYCTSKCDLREHIKIHPESNYVCNICEKAFCSNISLKVHRQVHSQKKTYPCEKCGKVCKRRAALLSHLKRHT